MMELSLKITYSGLTLKIKRFIPFSDYPPQVIRSAAEEFAFILE